MSKSIRSAWLHPWLAKKWSLFMRRFHSPLLIGVYISLILDFLGVFLKAESGRSCALLALTLGTPGCLVRLTLLRSDVVNLLHRTSEYWFFTFANIMSVTLLGLYLADSRGGLMFGMWVGFQSCVLVDADVATARHYMNATAAMLVFALVLMVLIFFEQIDEVSHFVMFRTKDRALSIEVALVNSWATVIVVLGRNLYRRRAAMKNVGSNSNVVHCISYRCKIKLTPIRTESDSPTSERVASSRALSTLTQLKLKKVEERFDAANIVAPVIQRLFPQGKIVPLSVRVAILALAVIAVVASVASFVLPTTGLRTQVAAFASTALFFVVSATLLQRQMLRRLVHSFDFAFLSIQLTLAHLGVCDLFYWDGRCLIVVACWMWMHLALSIDALTPIMKRRWRLRAQFAAPVVIVFIAAQIAMFSVLVLDVDYGIQDRVIYSMVVHRRMIAGRVAPFLLNRVITLLGWSFRKLWRIWTQQEDEVTLLHGSVFYDSKLSQVRLRKEASRKRSAMKLPRRAVILPQPRIAGST